jgi:hypothetical protein
MTPSSHYFFYFFTMRIVPVLFSLFAANRKSTKWFIDGNNLMGHKGTPRERVQVLEKVKPMSENGLDTTLLFDNAPGDAAETVVERDGTFSTVIMGKGKTADDYILEEISAIKESRPPHAFVQIVTADRDLRRKALGTRTVVRGVINPVVFWRRYRPRLIGLKKHDNADNEE